MLCRIHSALMCLVWAKILGQKFRTLNQFFLNLVLFGFVLNVYLDAGTHRCAHRHYKLPYTFLQLVLLVFVDNMS